MPISPPESLHALLQQLHALRQALAEQRRLYTDHCTAIEQTTRSQRRQQEQSREAACQELETQKEQLQATYARQLEDLHQHHNTQIASLEQSLRDLRLRLPGEPHIDDEASPEIEAQAQASAQATVRYQNFIRTCEKLAAQLQDLQERFAEQPSLSEEEPSIVLPQQLDPERHSGELADILHELQDRLQALDHWALRLRASGLLLVVLQMLLLAATVTINWLFWQASAPALWLGTASVSWVFFATLLLIMRESAAAYRRREQGRIACECRDFAQALHDLQERGGLLLKPDQVLDKTLSELAAQAERQQQMHEEQRQALRRQQQQALEQREQERRKLRQQAAEQEAQLRDEQEQALRAIEQQRTKLMQGCLTEDEEALLRPLLLKREAAEQKLRQLLDELLVLLRSWQSVQDSAYHPWTDPYWQDLHLREGPPRNLRLGLCRSSLSMLAQAAGWQTSQVQDQPLECPLVLDMQSKPLLALLGPAQQARPLLQQAILGLMLSSPAGSLRFSLCDPQGLGDSFAPFLQLSDAQGSLLGPKVWTSSGEIEQCLSNLSQQGEKVIQKFLRDRFSCLADYNAAAGELREPYHILVLCDFPHALSPAAIERLGSLLRYGPRCGIILWVHSEQAPFKGLDTNLICQQGLFLRYQDQSWQVEDPALADWTLQTEALPEADEQRRLIDLVAQAHAQLARRAIPLRQALPEDQTTWGQQDSATALRIPIGRSGAHRIQYLELGQGTAQHVLIAGRTGSGKSTLLHAIILSAAVWYQPQQVEFFLIDFKKGVEFKAYARQQLPHARVIAVESDREYALSVLRRLDQELEDRGARYRALGVQDVSSFRAAAPTEALPRQLLIIDEFHEFFVEDDSIARDAALLLERFVRQGRAFGLHVILGSQSLSGSMSLARSALGQMGVRIALQCNEADSQLILNEENLAARLLDRPGEAIYNASSGQVAANSPFQVFWVDESEQEDLLAQLRSHATADSPVPWVFEGNQPAHLRANHQLRELICGPAQPLGEELRGYLGEPNAIKGPCELLLPRRFAAHLLIAGQNRPAVHGMTCGLLASLAARHRQEGPRIILVDAERSDQRASERLQRFALALPLQLEYCPPADIPARISELAALLAEEDTTMPATLLIILGLGRLRSLRQADEFALSSSNENAVGQHFADCLLNGPERGLHCIVWSESPQLLHQALRRSTLRAFNQRLLFQMNASDSSDLIDDGSASHLGLHHAVLCDMENLEREKFRPYAALDEGEYEEILGFFSTND